MKENGWEKTVFLTDGFPRSIENWEGWQSVFGDEAEIIGILHLECTEEEMTKRILERAKTSGRNDDKEEVLIKRFKVNKEETQPVLDVFKAMNKVFSINANGTQEEVLKEAYATVDSLNLHKDSEKTQGFEIRTYLKNKVDAFIKPLMTDIMREKPDDVHTFMVNWLNDKGTKIKNEQA